MKQLLGAAVISLPLLTGCGNAETAPDWKCVERADFSQTEKSAVWNVERTMEDKVVRVCAILNSTSTVRTSRFYFQDGRFVDSDASVAPVPKEGN
ncbi:MAG: hypothetical protein WA194_08725 [Patescibacteria group bacterium]